MNRGSRSASEAHGVGRDMYIFIAGWGVYVASSLGNSLCMNVVCVSHVSVCAGGGSHPVVRLRENCGGREWRVRRGCV